MGWDVSILIDKEALREQKIKFILVVMAWDKKIKLLEKNDNKSDLINVGTPPDKHLEVAYQELNSEPDALLRKPLCTPDESLKAF